MHSLPVTSTGIAGLDDILQGGWPQGRIYLVLGHPGTGKTTLGFQFLLDGARSGERTLYISLSETREELQQVVGSHGWSLDGIDLYDLSAAEGALGLTNEQTMFDPSDVEFRQTSRAITAEISRVEPTRVVIDSLAELALLAGDSLAFRRELLMLKQALMQRGATVLLLSDATTPEADRQLQSLAHGVLELEELSPELGPERRRLRVRKLRGAKFSGGYHDFRLERGGITVFPRLIAAEHGRPYTHEPLRSGLPALDAMLGGGLARGASTLFMGPAGSAKSTLVSQFAAAALRAGEPTAMFLFDEGAESLLARCDTLGLDLRSHLETGLLSLEQIDPAQRSPGEFIYRVRDAVERRGATFVAIDSINGYMYAMPEERFLTAQLHELLMYLNQLGVTTALVMAQSGLVGAMTSPADISHVADAVVCTRFFEAGGRVLRAISMLKKRRGSHEETIRQLRITDDGLVIGQPLDAFQGVLTGVPTFTGDAGGLLEKPDGDA